MTNPQNVVVITDKLLDFLRGTHDTFLRQELVTRITQLAERFAPSNQWFLRTMTTVFELGGDLVQAEVAENLITLLAEGSGDDDEADEALRQEAADAYMALASTEELPDVLLAAMCWLLGEYGYTSKQHSLQEVMDAVVSIAERPALGEATRAAALSAISKLAAQLGNLPPSAAALTEQYALSQSVDLQQRAREMQALATDAMLMQAVLPVDAACEDIDVDKDLSFLNDFVQSARAAGAKEYSPPEDLDASTRAKRAGSGLRFDAYDAPTMPTRGSTSVSVPSATEAGPFGALSLCACRPLGRRARDVTHLQLPRPPPSWPGQDGVSPRRGHGHVRCGHGAERAEPVRRQGRVGRRGLRGASMPHPPSYPPACSHPRHGAPSRGGRAGFQCVGRRQARRPVDAGVGARA